MTQTTALARPGTPAELAQFHGTHIEPMQITNMLEEAARSFNLVSPATSCAAVPDGFAVQMSAVLIDANDTYDPGGGKRALGKTALNRIAAAAGVSWIPSQSGRLDDGKDPHYVHYRAVGRYRHFDGTECVVQGEKIMDLRKGSAATESMKETELRMQRKFILEHAQTKAQLRAVRSMGLRTAYTAQELQKPFVVAKLAFTGQTQDPELRRRFAEMAAASALGSTNALYGTRELPAPDLGKSAPPPVEESPEDDDEPIDDVPEAVSDSSAQGKAASPSPSSGAAAPTAPASPAPERPATSFACKVSEKYPVEALRGKCYADLTDEQLSSYVDWAVNRAKVEGPTWTQKGRDGAKKAIDAAYADVDWRMGQKGSGPQGNGGEW